MLEVILLCICFILFVLCYNKVDVKLPPVCKGGLPFLGHAHLFWMYNTHELFMDLLKSFSKECERLGGVMRWSLGPTEFYWVTDPEDALRIGKANVNKHSFYNFAENIFGNGLVISSGSKWKTHKKLLSPAFSVRASLDSLKKINIETRKHLVKLDSKVGRGPIELHTDLRLIVLNTVLATLFTSFEKVDDSYKEHLKNIDEALDIIITRIQTIFYHSKFLYNFSKLSRREKVLMKAIGEFTEELIKRKRDNNKTESDKVFLDLLLELHDEGKLTMKEVQDEIITFMTAALDTTTLTVNNILVLLGTHLDVQDKVFKELTRVLGTEDRDVDKKDLANLVYLEAVVKECLRLYPPGPFTIRTFEEPIQLSKYTLPADTRCLIALSGVNRDPWWGKDRETFRPERWFEREELGTYFAAFSFGRRSCIGKTYAMLTLKIMVAHIIRRYSVTADATQLRFKFDFILKPVAGHFISIEKRN